MPPEIIVGVRESLMLLVNSHILKMATMLKPSAEYNRRAAIIEGFRAERNENNSVLWIFDQPFMTLWQNIRL